MVTVYFYLIGFLQCIRLMSLHTFKIESLILSSQVAKFGQGELYYNSLYFQIKTNQKKKIYSGYVD